MKPKNYYSFFWIALLIILVFILQISFEGFTSIFVLNEKALGAEFYRFISAIFLHGSISHLIYNLFALLLFGFILENLIGTRRFLIVFFGSGILANVFSVFFYDSSLGASGAIYGIIGCISVIRPMMMVWAFGILMPMFVAAIVWIIGDLIGLFIPDNVGHIAHLSGIFIGIIVGFVVRSSRKIKERNTGNKIKIPEEYMKGWEKVYMR